MVAGAAGASGQAARIPLVFWAHDAISGKHWTGGWRGVRPDLVICNSRYTAASIPNLYPGVATVVVAPPVNTDAPQLTSSERAALRATLETGRCDRDRPGEPHGFLEGSCCRDEALAPLRGLPWIFWIAGGAQRPAEVKYEASLRAAADRLGVADRVRFLGERTDVRQLLAAADIHCQPNLRPEPFGITFVEALAAGLPVVTSAIGGALEIVDDSCGSLVPPNEPAALTAAFRRLIGDPALRARAAPHASSPASAICDPEAQMGRLRCACCMGVRVEVMRTFMARGVVGGWRP